MGSTSAPCTLYGRASECARLDALVTEARAGHSGALVLDGEPGIGKSALLDHLADGVQGCRVLRVTGVESEMELAFAGLHQLCRPLFHLVDRLPPPQAAALRAAFGLAAGDRPDRFLVGLAALSLISEGGHERPLVCLVDDAQWLDRASAQTIAFIARRLEAESVVVVIATRPGPDDVTWTGLPRLTVRGLGTADAAALLATVLPGELDRRVRARILAETRGNPLALLELPRMFSVAELTFGPETGGRRALGRRLVEGFCREIAPLPAETRRLLLLAAAEPVGDPALLWRAAAHLGLDRSAAAPAVDAGLIRVADAVVFRHPLVRTVVHERADPDERLAVHAALAAATDPARDPDRRAWHRALAVCQPDEDVAAELEASSERALSQGGFVAAGAFLERAATLTPEPHDRARRQIDAAQAMVHAGSFEAALRLLTAAELEPLGGLLQARAAMLRAQVAFASRRGSESLPMLLEVARRLQPFDPELALDSYVDALTAALFASRLAPGDGLTAVARAALAAPEPQAPRPGQVLLRAVASLWVDGYEAAAPRLREAVRAFADDDLSRDEGVRLTFLASAVASALWDDDGWDALTVRHLATVRRAGAMSALPLALNTRAVVEVVTGDLFGASRLVDELAAMGEHAEAALLPYGAAALAAFRGDDHAAALIDQVRADATARGEGVGLAFTGWVAAVLHNGAGRYRQAFEACRDVVGDPEEIALGGWALAELVEAAVRVGEREVAAAARGTLARMAGASGTAWAAGVAARCAAQLEDGDRAGRLYQEATDHLRGTGVRTDLARTRLLHGEWLRRAGRRRAARDELHAAHEAFDAVGMDGFAERARRELAEVGETLVRRSDPTSHELTSQELHIARLAASGLTNADIAAELYLSHRTVEWHMRKVFMKLGLTSRRQLRDRLAPARTGA